MRQRHPTKIERKGQSEIRKYLNYFRNENFLITSHTTVNSNCQSSLILAQHWLRLTALESILCDSVSDTPRHPQIYILIITSAHIIQSVIAGSMMILRSARQRTIIHVFISSMVVRWKWAITYTPVDAVWVTAPRQQSPGGRSRSSVGQTHPPYNLVRW